MTPKPPQIGELPRQRLSIGLPVFTKTLLFWTVDHKGNEINKKNMCNHKMLWSSLYLSYNPDSQFRTY